MLNKTIGFIRANIVTILCVLMLNVLLILITRTIYLKNQRKLLIMTDTLEGDNSFDEEEIKNNMIMEEASILNMRYKVRSMNYDQPIFNNYIYNYVLKKCSVIVIKVTRRHDHLNQLVKSLGTVAGITRSLLIFSHNYYDDNINNLIQSIDFAKYIQIFYPYSSQLHPHIFPSDDCTYCSGNYKCESSMKRNSELAQLKHHWWWTVNQVFDYMKATKNYNGYILFLDEPQYVADDILHTFKQLTGKGMSEDCPQCEMVCLGCHRPDSGQFHLEDGYNVIESFGATEYSMGISFNKTVWNKIKNLRTHFCYHNDYDWDNSLRFLARMTPKGKFLMLSTMGPRVFQTESCGDSNRQMECKVDERIYEIKRFLKHIRRSLFPKNMKTVVGEQNSTVQPEQGNWDDIRDQELCMFIASKTRSRFAVKFREQC